MYNMGMDDKRTMTLNLTHGEMEVLEELAKKKELNKTAVLRQALRLYQMVDEKLSRGETLFFEDKAAKKRAEVFVL